MGLTDLVIFQRAAGALSSYKHNAEVAAEQANKDEPQGKVIPITDLAEAKKIAKEKLGEKDTQLVTGAIKLQGGTQSVMNAIVYCSSLSTRLGKHGGGSEMKASNDWNIVVCHDDPQYSDIREVETRTR